MRHTLASALVIFLRSPSISACVHLSHQHILAIKISTSEMHFADAVNIDDDDDDVVVVVVVAVAVFVSSSFPRRHPAFGQEDDVVPLCTREDPASTRDNAHARTHDTCVVFSV